MADMPMMKWIDIFKKNDISYILKSSKDKLCHRAESVYISIRNQIIDSFGMSDDFIQILRNNMQIEKYRQQQVLTGDYSTEMLIEMLEIENKDLMKGKENTDLYQGLIPMGKFFPNVPVNPDTITIERFHELAKAININIKENGRSTN